MRTVRPSDYDTVIESVKKTNRLVCLEEAWPLGSISTEITYMVQKRAFDYLDAPVGRIAAPFSPVPFSPVLEAHYLPSVDDIQAGIRAAVARPGI